MSKSNNLNPDILKSSTKPNVETVKGCPKFLKNGPCGGYRDGKCEVFPNQKCLFVAAWERNPGALKKEIA